MAAAPRPVLAARQLLALPGACPPQSRQIDLKPVSWYTAVESPQELGQLCSLIWKVLKSWVSSEFDLECMKRILCMKSKAVTAA